MNPFRPPDWRWRRAMSIHDGHGPAASKRLDTPPGYKWIREANRFLRERSQCRTELAIEQLAANNPHIFWANWLWNHGGAQKDSVEAHMLARETNFEIGFRCGIPPATLEAYESIFFNVREKLQHHKYVLHVVLGPAMQRGFGQGDHGLLWKLYGYFLGPYVLDAMESSFINPVWCGSPDAVGAAIQDDAIGTMKLKAAMAAKMINVNSHTQVSLLELYVKYTEVERTTDSAGKANDQLLEHINAMMEAMPLNVAGTDPKTGRKLPPTILSSYDASSVELTFEETMRVAVNRPIRDGQTLKSLTFESATQPPDLLNGPQNPGT